MTRFQMYHLSLPVNVYLPKHTGLVCIFQVQNTDVISFRFIYTFAQIFIMGKPAARITDMHVCPMVSPGPVPHVGGPVIGPGMPTVLIGGIPAAVMGDACTCVGPPDTIVLGSAGVFIGGKPAARMGDQCAHGGKIVAGLPTVLIGKAGGVGAYLWCRLILFWK